MKTYSRGSLPSPLTPRAGGVWKKLESAPFLSSFVSAPIQFIFVISIYFASSSPHPIGLSNMITCFYLRAKVSSFGSPPSF